MSTIRLTTAQALIRFLAAQYTERDGVERRLFEGCFAIFGHGNLAGVGQALQEEGSLTYYQSRNEQAMVHAAVAFARMRSRLATLACTTSIGPGATNMVTGAALATINRLPVLLLPGDVFATRRPHPVLQGLEAGDDANVSVNDCLRPVCRYFARIDRPEQLEPAMLEAARVLSDPAQTGAVTLALPQDVQAEAFEFPAELFERRVWHVSRAQPDVESLARAVELIRAAKRPLIVAGGGAIFSEAGEALRGLCEATGVPECETQAGKGALPHGHPSALGPVGATGGPGANRAAREADLVIGVGTAWDDFTTASKTAFQNPDVRFVNVNLAPQDAAKHAGLPLIADARATLMALIEALDGHRVDAAYERWAAEQVEAWDRELDRLYHLGHGPLPAQSEVIGAVCEASRPEDVVICAAGSMPGDLGSRERAARSRPPGGPGHGYAPERGLGVRGIRGAASRGGPDAGGADGRSRALPRGARRECERGERSRRVAGAGRARDAVRRPARRRLPATRGTTSCPPRTDRWSWASAGRRPRSEWSPTPCVPRTSSRRSAGTGVWSGASTTC